MANNEFREADLREIYDREHPQLDISSYRLDDVLDPLLDAEMRTCCEKHGYDYDYFKERFSASYQIIPPRTPGLFALELLRKRVIPLNELSYCFRWSVLFTIDARRELMKEKSKDALTQT